MTATSITDGTKVVVELTCDFCGAQVIHTDTVSLATVTAYLSRAGWLITDGPTSGHQTTSCPRCAPVGGVGVTQPQRAVQEVRDAL